MIKWLIIIIFTYKIIDYKYEDHSNIKVIQFVFKYDYLLLLYTQKLLYYYVFILYIIYIPIDDDYANGVCWVSNCQKSL